MARNARPDHEGAPVIVRGGTVVDETGTRRADVAIEAGVIVEVAPSIDPPTRAIVLDASGCVVAPGLVDLHTHLREPGGERAETIETGARAGALGGYTALLAMPNTTPAIDCAAVVRDVYALAENACCEVAVAGAISKGRLGDELAELGEMAALGVVLFTDDGRGVQDAGLMRRALEYGRDLSVVLAEHCEDEALARGGSMNEGEWSSRLGIPAQPALAEEAMLERDLALVRLTGAPMHFLHLSARGSIEAIVRAKTEGLPVTAEVTPHHLCLTDALAASYDALFKVNPPLRSDDDVAAVRSALSSGAIDAVATDHAPHTAESKTEPFDRAPFGMLGLETALSVVYSELCDQAPSVNAGGETLSIEELFALFSWRPARIARFDRSSGQGGPIKAGHAAHLCVFDPSIAWTVDPSHLASRSTNTPFAGRQLFGRVRHTIYAGEIVVEGAVATR